jgi:hypothetical protein
MSAVAGITFFPYFLTVTDVLTIACIHIAIIITVSDFVHAAACFPALTCIHASGVPAVLLVIVNIRHFTIGLSDFGYMIVHFLCY